MRGVCATSQVTGQFAPSLQGVGYGEGNTVTRHGSLSDPNGARVPEPDLNQPEALALDEQRDICSSRVQSVPVQSLTSSGLSGMRCCRDGRTLGLLEIAGARGPSPNRISLAQSRSRCPMPTLAN